MQTSLDVAMVEKLLISQANEQVQKKTKLSSWLFAFFLFDGFHFDAIVVSKTSL